MCANQKESFNKKFNEEFAELLKHKDSNNFYMDEEQYKTYLQDIKNAKEAKSLTTLQRRRLQRFDIFVVGGVEKLIVPLKEGETNIKYYVKNDRMFDVLHEAHISVGHGGKHRMIAELSKKYKNCTQEIILLFLKFCVSCQKKQKSTKKGLVVRPMIFSEMNSRCQVDLIDMQSSADGPYKFIMVYQDHLTKFIQLRPLTSKRAAEVAKNLLDIFCIFGAPNILQSDNGREFVNCIIQELCTMWPGLQIVHGRPSHSQSQGSVERANQDIQNMLMTWMTNENCNQWSDGLRFVQFMKKRAHHAGIQRSPFQAMFGCDAKLGLSTTSLPKEVYLNVRTEEELQEIIEHNSMIATEQDINQLSDDISEHKCDSGQDAVGTQTESLCENCNASETANGLCEICKKEADITHNRINAKECLMSQAKKMKTRSNSQFPICKIGDTVRVPIPDVDRGRGDFRNILLVIIDVDNAGLYELGNADGTIDTRFTRNQFTPCNVELVDLTEVSDEIKSLRQLANIQSHTGGQGYTRCNCKQGCNSKRCKCKLTGVLCNSKCHHSLSCVNK